MKHMKKCISVLLSMTMVISVFVVDTAEQVKAATNHTRDEAVAWANSKMGQYVYNGQCVGLIYEYLDYLGHSELRYNENGGRNACDFANASLPSGWSYVYGNYAPGDIAVWKTNYSSSSSSTGWAGHVGIIESCDNTGFNAYQQNRLGHQYVEKAWHLCTDLQCAIRPDWPSSDTTEPIVKDVVVSNVTSTGYTVSCTVTDSGGSGLNRVEFPTWTIKNDQDDLKTPWPQGTSNGSRYTYTVKISEHNNEHGPYSTHIYGWDNAGNRYCYKLRVLVPESYPSSISMVDYSIFNNHLYVLYDYYLDWATAENFCVSKGGHLSSITSSGENEIVYSLLQKGSRVAYYIGGYDYGSEGSFVFTDGSTMTYKNWHTGEPNNDKSENYTNMYRESGRWNDTRGYSYEGEDRCGFVLELDLNSVTKQQAYDRLGIDLFTDISSVTISSIADKTYTGLAIEPEIIIASGSKTLTKGTDYTVSYSNNKNVGIANVAITGKGNYKGSKSVDFNIIAADASGFAVSSISDQKYTGSEITPEVTVKFNSKTLVKDEDYVLVYSDNTNAGTATVTIVGIGNFKGTKKVSFEIIENNSPVVPVNNGWVTDEEGDKYYYDETGNPVKGWKTISGKKYYFKKTTGAMVTGWKTLSNKKYYFNTKTGAMTTDAKKIDGKYYLFSTNGVMQKSGWKKDSKGNTYYLKSSGVAYTKKWAKKSGKWYYFGSNGKMVKGKSLKIGKKTYKFKANGVCKNP